MFWGSTSGPHIGDVVMSLFFTLRSTVHDWGWPKNGQTWHACLRSNVAQRGRKGPKVFNLSVFLPFRTPLGPFGTPLGPSGPLWTISNKNWYFAPKHHCITLLCPFGAKNHVCLKCIALHCKEKRNLGWKKFLPIFSQYLGGNICANICTKTYE